MADLAKQLMADLAKFIQNIRPSQWMMSRSVLIRKAVLMLFTGIAPAGKESFKNLQFYFAKYNSVTYSIC